MKIWKSKIFLRICITQLAIILILFGLLFYLSSLIISTNSEVYNQGVMSTYSAVRDFQKTLLPIGLAFIGVSMFIMIYTAARVLKPLSQLCSAIDTIAKGNFEERVDVSNRKTETELLATRFNELIDQIQDFRTNLLKNEEQVRKQKEFLQKVINHNPNAIYAMDSEGRHTLVNKAYADFFHVIPEEMVGKKEEEFNPIRIQTQTFLKENQQVINTLEELETEVSIFDPNGKQYWLDVVKVPIIGDEEEETQVLCVATDITERKEQEEKIRFHAYHDDLTNLPNRKMFFKRLEEELEDAKEKQEILAVLFLDLDGFKQVNDTFGHNVGDRLLQVISERIGSCIREKDTVFRLGGDEFTVILQNIEDKHVAAESAKSMMDMLTKPYEIEGNTFVMTTSIGISIYPDNGLDSSSLTKYADMAMYQGKQQGKNTYRFYTTDMESDITNNIRLKMELRNALEKNQFFIHYQPKVSLESEQIEGVEALLRWEHEELGLVSPNEFIPVIEETGMIHAIGEWILKTVCTQHKVWRDQGYPTLKVAVNLSPIQLKDPDIIEKITDILQETNMEPEWLEFEITETSLIENQKEATKILKKLRKMGIRIAIDDFGTGYSSLHLLKRLPVDILKIDRAFIQDNDDHAILESILEMAKKLQLTVVAEGVETKEQLDYLKDQYCQEAQGFFISHPLSKEKFESFVNAQLSREKSKYLKIC
ncbi:putative bifunctional diguanylate cyclase/phosphodiesterase [Terrihalobacillus insolitus]|uniref:putative bifunctional diguanylate cyclase/phosphodiesterase n=1 Tax=Terrihalobacillus insolitus TaxID=2950438 RepID=UPI00233FD365|nr:EAL domain-containing protein [Terrihalobacillus insolitus]MDC3414988.1 EAL domain-containing protein [Terrihalobacillus insolitus]